MNGLSRADRTAGGIGFPLSMKDGAHRYVLSGGDSSTVGGTADLLCKFVPDRYLSGTFSFQGTLPLDPTKGTFEKVPLETSKLSIRIRRNVIYVSKSKSIIFGCSAER